MTRARFVSQKKLLYPLPHVFVCPRTQCHAPFHWFNRCAYLKLGVSASCQLVIIMETMNKGVGS